MMAINIYEQWVFDSVEKEGLQVYTPYKDRGIDAVITDGGSKFTRIQIKGSRGYEEGGGWYLVNRAKLEKSLKLTDLWVFVWTRAQHAGKLTPEFLAISPDDLMKRLACYSTLSKAGTTWHLYLGRRLDPFPEQIIDARGLRDRDRKVTELDGLKDYPKRVYTERLVDRWRAVV